MATSTLQPNVYRSPRNPGFLGGYQWGSLFLGLVLLLITNCFATQFVAHKFGYQGALGRPALRLRSAAIYQPFAWAGWTWQHGSSPNAAIRMPVLLGTLIVVSGSFMTMCAVFAQNIRRTKKLSENTEDLHGSARWAVPEDVAQTGLLQHGRGVYVGGWHDEGAGYLHYLRHDGPEHILAFAPTRSGKGVGLVIPTLLAWEESTIVYDIKGENWAKTAGYRQRAGHVCFKFSPVEEKNCSRFNPLAEVRLFTKRDVSDAQNIADMIVRTGEDSPQERYWQDAAASITTGMVLHVCYAAAREGRVASLADLAGVFTRPGHSFRETLEKILDYSHDPDLRHQWVLPGGLSTATHPVVKEKAAEMLDKEDKDFSGVLSTAKTALTLYSDPLVAANTAASDFSIQDLVNYKRPISLYLVVPPSDKIRLRPLIRLIFTMIVNRLTERMDFEGSAQKRNRHRLLFMVDEFPSLKRMELFADALSYMAGYGLKAYLITQDVRQIVDEYGPNESIVSNCHVRVAYAPNNYETAELLSKMTGAMTVRKASFNFSGSRLSPLMEQVSQTVDHVERPLMTPDEVMRLRPARKSGQGSAERIVTPGDMLIFVSGHYPIYGKQMLYFADPHLKARADYQPPTQFFTIQKGTLAAQPPAGKTSNQMSKVEAMDEAEDSLQLPTQLERSYQEELGHDNSPLSELLDVQTSKTSIYHRWIAAGESISGHLVASLAVEKRQVVIVESEHGHIARERAAGVLDGVDLPIPIGAEVVMISAAGFRQVVLTRVLQQDRKNQPTSSVPPPKRKRHPFIEDMQSQAKQVTPPHASDQVEA